MGRDRRRNRDRVVRTARDRDLGRESTPPRSVASVRVSTRRRRRGRAFRAIAVAELGPELDPTRAPVPGGLPAHDHPLRVAPRRPGSPNCGWSRPRRHRRPLEPGGNERACRLQQSLRARHHDHGGHRRRARPRTVLGPRHGVHGLARPDRLLEGALSRQARRPRNRRRLHGFRDSTVLRREGHPRAEDRDPETLGRNEPARCESNSSHRAG